MFDGVKKIHTDLKVWQQSIDFAIAVYKQVESFPHEERYGLVSQMKRCAISIPANISEGASRNRRKDFCRFLYISRGSMGEIETYFEICRRLNYLTEKNHSDLLGDLEMIRKMLCGLIKSLNKS